MYVIIGHSKSDDEWAKEKGIISYYSDSTDYITPT